MVNLGILGGDQYQLIAQQIDARVNFLLHAVVHPLQVSGGKYVRWRALLDLLSQRRTCSIAGDDFDTALLCESCINIIECVRKRGEAPRWFCLSYERLLLKQGGAARPAIRP